MDLGRAARERLGGDRSAACASHNPAPRAAAWALHVVDGEARGPEAAAATTCCCRRCWAAALSALLLLLLPCRRLCVRAHRCLVHGVHVGVVVHGRSVSRTVGGFVGVKPWLGVVVVDVRGVEGVGLRREPRRRGRAVNHYPRRKRHHAAQETRQHVGGQHHARRQGWPCNCMHVGWLRARLRRHARRQGRSKHHLRGVGGALACAGTGAP